MKMSELKNLIRETLAEMDGPEMDSEAELELLARDYSNALEDLRGSVDELFASVDSRGFPALHRSRDSSGRCHRTLTLINEREEILDEIMKKISVVRSTGFVYSRNYIKSVRR